ncbi:MAG: hypothetical protein QG608_2647, partial [Actinomycetota bacterium]|nr:hypothetical protein [Actinomycetota bacterium]
MQENVSESLRSGAPVSASDGEVGIGAAVQGRGAGQHCQERQDRQDDGEGRHTGQGRARR